MAKKPIIIKNPYTENLCVYGEMNEKNQGYKYSSTKNKKLYFDLEENKLYINVEEKVVDEINTEKNCDKKYTESDKYIQFNVAKWIIDNEDNLLEILNPLIETYYKFINNSKFKADKNDLNYKKFNISSDKQSKFIEGIIKKAFISYRMTAYCPCLERDNHKIFILPNKKLIINIGFLKNMYWVMNILRYN